MSIKIGDIARQPRRKNPYETLIMNGWPKGLDTSVRAEMIDHDAMSWVCDMKLNDQGRFETRDAIYKYTSAATTGTVKNIEGAVIGGTNYTLIGDDDNKVYYLSGTAGTAVTNIDTVSGVPDFLPYNNVSLVLDGSYIKYIDNVSEDAKLAYDTSETMYDNLNLVANGTTALSSSGVGCTFTTPSWDAGFTIPPTKVSAYVQETTAGTGTITCDFVKVSGGATTTSVSYTGTIPTSAADVINITISSSDITNELEPSTQYYCLLKGSNVNLSHKTTASGGTLITGGSTPDTTKDPVMRVYPGRPPKGSFGDIADMRPFIAGDPDNPGVVHYGKLSIFEWGAIPAVDNSNTSYEVGGIKSLFDDLFIYGTQDRPYIARKTGNTESSWAIVRQFQQVWTLPKLLENIGHDLMAGSKDGCHMLKGVQEYGDLRTFSESDRVKRIIKTNWTTSAFSAYKPDDGQYWLYLPGYNYILVCHTKHPHRDPTGKLIYPWTLYEPPITPTCFKQVGDKMLMGCADGYLYTIGEAQSKDLGTTKVYPKFKLAYIQFPFGRVEVNKIQFIASSLTGSSFTIKARVNGNQETELTSETHRLPISDGVSIADLGGATVGDLTFSIVADTAEPWVDENFECFSLQLEICDINTIGNPVHFGGLMIQYRRLQQ